MLNESSPDEDLIQAALQGVKDANEAFERDPRKWSDEHAPIPPNIPLPQGSHIWITKEGLGAIRTFGAKWFRNSPSLKKGMTLETAKSWAVEAFGRLIAETQSGKSEYGGNEDCIPILKGFLADWSQKRFRHFVHYFPCFVTNNDETWSVGPVTIMPRKDWLDEVLSVSTGKSRSWVDAIRPQWKSASRELPKECESLPPLEKLRAQVALQNGPSPSVAKVVVEAGELSRSTERGRIAASLALDAIGLVLDSFSARATIRGPDDELRPRLQHTFSQALGGDITWSSRLDLPTGGAAVPRALAEMATYTARIGNILEALTKEVPTRGTPELDKRWLNALYWFSKARRKSADFICISLMGASLDILTKGARVNGIKELARLLLNNSDQTVISTDGRTQGKLLEAIYEKARSQFLHGGALGLLSELPIERTNADMLTAALLLSYFELLCQYDGTDDYDSFKNWIPTAPTAPVAS